jgi:hypothetical protein
MSNGTVVKHMKYAKGIELRKSKFVLLGAPLCGLLGLIAACASETQPLNSVADDSVGGAGGAGGSGGSGNSANSGGPGGADADSNSVDTSGSSNSGTGGTGPGTGDSSNSGTGGPGGAGSGPERDVLAEKLDILFVVDNSMAMADKQKYLALAAGELLERLADPHCIDGDDPALAEGCPEGQQREFAPVVDMHVGVISSSLGGHGGDLCSNTGMGISGWNPTKNDAGKLLPTVRDGLPSYQDQGFLAWDLLEVDGEAEHDLEALKSAMYEQIQFVGEMGCGYEAPLEAMYRFLIDPSPPKEIVVTDGASYPEKDAAGNVLVDTDVLEQRAHFLRPDSALAIVVFSDEDDCSVQDSGLGWATAAASLGENSSFTMPRATQVCETDPNDACCRSCGLVEESPPAGCGSLVQDASCAQGARDQGTDALNLRCFDQKRRFGFDLLYPLDRYVAGLTKTQIEDPWSCSDEECPLVRNPLFPPENPDNAFTRRASEVFFMSLVGVPWQDLATSESLTGEGLTYKSSFEADDWSLVVGSPSDYVAPEDPLMIASPDPRTGTHPVTGDPLASESSTDPQENAINGHESINVHNDTLQYACIFPLDDPRDCSDSPEPNPSCECSESAVDNNKALCQPPDGGSATTTQYFAGAMPGVRTLELTSKLPRGVPASICPKVIEGDADASAFGYNPAMRALVRELSSVLK